MGRFQLEMEIRFFYITLIILSIYPVEAQNSYSLNFDGEADYVEVPYGSAMIANAGQITLSGWVYPRNTNSGWPDFDAFFGFRNESDADFYLLQLDNYKVEGRLRVTGNVAYTVVTAAESISPDTWYHLALTYDGANLFVYINGIEAGSTEAFGQIINENVSLTIGRLVFQTTNFDLDGQADEVSLWNIALTEQQIQDYMYADLTGEAGLVGYWNFNEGAGDIANDAGGNDNDGLINGAAWSTDIPFTGGGQCDSSEVELWNQCYSIENTTELDLSNRGLTGEIPPEIGNLTNLTYLNLQWNDLTGSIPIEIGSLTNLAWLSLYFSGVTGLIPAAIGNLANLTHLDLQWNGLTGSIPPEIGNLANLIHLGLGTNELTGSIPPELGNLTNLTSLHLNSNNLTGAIPESICGLDLNWSSSSDFNISNNQLCPPYPLCVENYAGEQDTDNCTQAAIANETFPITYSLYNAYPNPFNPFTTLRYDLPEDAMVNITIYDMMGRNVKTMVNSQQNAGFKSIQWDATNDAGAPVSAGLYLYTIESKQFRQTKKMVLLK
tara:strand:- start:871 stop:2523 length:1653 start_codon:yes stop_codon:yes gene_type:complete